MYEYLLFRVYMFYSISGKVLLDSRYAYTTDELMARTSKGVGGTHGWDDTSPDPKGYEEGPMPDMRTTFLLLGPSISKGKAINWIKLVDEYQVFTYLMGIKAEPHNGTWSRVKGLFKAFVGLLPIEHICMCTWVRGSNGVLTSLPQEKLSDVIKNVAIVRKCNF